MKGNNKGYSLTEVLVTVGVASIIGGVAVVSYSGYKKGADKQDLCTSAISYVSAVKTCVFSHSSGVSGWDGWEITSWTPPGKPCQANDNTKLKDKLNFNCPGECLGRLSGDKKYHCLQLKRGTLRTIVLFDIDNQKAKYYCADSDKPEYDLRTSAQCSPTGFFTHWGECCEGGDFDQSTNSSSATSGGSVDGGTVTGGNPGESGDGDSDSDKDGEDGNSGGVFGR